MMGNAAMPIIAETLFKAIILHNERVDNPKKITQNKPN
jgi:hypothetical protein